MFASDKTNPRYIDACLYVLLSVCLSVICAVPISGPSEFKGSMDDRVIRVNASLGAMRYLASESMSTVAQDLLDYNENVPLKQTTPTSTVQHQHFEPHITPKPDAPPIAVVEARHKSRVPRIDWSDTTIPQNQFEKAQIDSSLIKYPTGSTVGSATTSNNSDLSARNVDDAPNKIKMQLLLDYPINNQLPTPTAAPVKKKKKPKKSKTTTALPEYSSTLPPLTTVMPRRTATVKDSGPIRNMFASVAEYLESAFAPEYDDEDEPEFDVVQLPPVPPQKAVTEIYHYYNFSTVPPQTTTRFKRADPIMSPPTIIYAMPPPYAGYPSYAYGEPQQQHEVHNIYRTKRTTLTPGGYQSVVQGAPYDGQVTSTNGEGNKNKKYMSTQIHVTSEYNPGPTISLEDAALALKKKGVKFGEDESSEEEYGMYDEMSFDGDDDDDDSDEEGESGNKENTSSGEDDEYDDEDDDDDDDRNELDDMNDDLAEAVGEDYSSDSKPVHRRKKTKPNQIAYVPPVNPEVMYEDAVQEYPVQEYPVRPIRIKRRRKTKKPIRRPKPVVINDDYSDEYDERIARVEQIAPLEQEEPGFFDNMFGDFFSSSWFWPSSWSPFRMFSSSEETAETRRRESRGSTTPMNDVIKSEHPSEAIIFSDFSTNDLKAEANDNGGLWSNIFGGSALNEGDHLSTSPMSPVTTTERDPGFWSWFGGSGEDDQDDDDATVAPTAMEESTESSGSGWNIFGMFQSSPSTTPAVETTTRRPFISVSNPLQNPQAWLGILAQHLATTRQPAIDSASSQKKAYTNHQLWRLHPHTDDQLTFLADYRSTPEGSALQWWRGPTKRGPTDIVVPPNLVADVKESLSYEEIPYDVVLWDLEKAILYENPEMTRREKIELISVQGHPLSWYRYHRYADITRYLEYMQRKHPDTVELLHIGRSFEGRPMIIAKISAVEPGNSKSKSYSKKRKPKQKSAVFIESGSHAREWIGPASATWILNRLIDHIHGNDSLGETIRSVDWYVLPVLNPDGYEFSHTYDRFWRKTRSKHPDKDGSMFSIAMDWIRKDAKAKKDDCYGTDPNRNWAHLWSEQGSSQSECSEFYAGPRAFSEPETKSVSTFLMDNKKQIKLFLSLHSYGQLISYPSGTTNASYSSIRPSDELHEMAQVALESLRSTGSSTRYTLDVANEMLFARSGAADAFAMHKAAIKYAYTLDLRDTGTHGFLLPASNIEAAAREAFEIVRGMVDFM